MYIFHMLPCPSKSHFKLCITCRLKFWFHYWSWLKICNGICSLWKTVRRFPSFHLSKLSHSSVSFWLVRFRCSCQYQPGSLCRSIPMMTTIAKVFDITWIFLLHQLSWLIAFLECKPDCCNISFCDKICHDMSFNVMFL